MNDKTTCKVSELKNPVKRVIIACEVVRPEFDFLLDGRDDIGIVYVEQGLHDHPETMPVKLQEIIDEIDPEIPEIVMGYGLCGNGLVGVKSKKQRLIIPRVHDCTTFMLGSKCEYMRIFNEGTGTLFLSKGWLNDAGLNVDELLEKYTPKYGRDKAVSLIKMIFKSYKRILMIDTRTGDFEPAAQKAKRFADVLELKYEETEGKHDFLKNIIEGNYPVEDFICLEPNEVSSQNQFLASPAKTE